MGLQVGANVPRPALKFVIMSKQRISLHGSKYFDIVEFVDARTWLILGAKAACLIDPRIVRVCDLLREVSGQPVWVNDWFLPSTRRLGKVPFDSSGFRAVWDNTGGSLSQHRCGRAADVKLKGQTPKQVFDLIMTFKDEFQDAGLTTMENIDFTRSWNHLDVRPRVEGWHPKDGFLIVNP